MHDFVERVDLVHINLLVVISFTEIDFLWHAWTNVSFIKCAVGQHLTSLLHLLSFLLLCGELVKLRLDDVLLLECLDFLRLLDEC